MDRGAVGRNPITSYREKFLETISIFHYLQTVEQSSQGSKLTLNASATFLRRRGCCLKGNIIGIWFCITTFEDSSALNYFLFTFHKLSRCLSLLIALKIRQFPSVLTLSQKKQYFRNISYWMLIRSRSRYYSNILVLVGRELMLQTFCRTD